MLLSLHEAIQNEIAELCFICHNPVKVSHTCMHYGKILHTGEVLRQLGFTSTSCAIFPVVHSLWY